MVNTNIQMTYQSSIIMGKKCDAILFFYIFPNIYQTAFLLSNRLMYIDLNTRITEICLHHARPQ